MCCLGTIEPSFSMLGREKGSSMTILGQTFFFIFIVPEKPLVVWLRWFLVVCGYDGIMEPVPGAWIIVFLWLFEASTPAVSSLVELFPVSLWLVAVRPTGLLPLPSSIVGEATCLLPIPSASFELLLLLFINEDPKASLEAFAAAELFAEFDVTCLEPNAPPTGTVVFTCYRY